MDPQPERVASSISVASYVGLLRGNGNFRRLWLAQIVSEIGDRFLTLSIYTFLFPFTGKARAGGLWLAQIVSEIGDWFYTLSIYTLLLQLTGNAGSVALALVLQVLPQTFVGPMAGVVNDRLRRKD